MPQCEGVPRWPAVLVSHVRRAMRSLRSLQDDSLRSTHDVAEELQTKLESLPNVERAYVHVDYETSHAPEHFLKKEL